MEWVILILILALQIWSIGLYYKWESYNKKKGENIAIKEDSREIDYEKEKGKNLATKEDIAQITKEIESVKNEISTQKQRETEYLYKRNECIIDFLNCLDELNLYRMKISRISNTLGTPDVSKQFLCDLENYSHKLSKQYRLLIVYNPNKKCDDFLMKIYNDSYNFFYLIYALIFQFHNKSVEYYYIMQERTVLKTRIIANDKIKQSHVTVFRNNTLYLNIGNALSNINRENIINPIRTKILRVSFISFNIKNNFQFGRFIHSFLFSKIEGY
jgi:hypothetical protein